MLKCIPIIVFIFCFFSLGVYADMKSEYNPVNPPNPPVITYPTSVVNTLKPNIAWFGEGHTACQVEITDSNGKVVWLSDEELTFRPYIQTEKLPSSSELTAKVRIKNSLGWSEWSKPQSFKTPKTPIVKILSPENAARVKGPYITFSWDIQSDVTVDKQEISIDGSKFEEISASERDYSIQKNNYTGVGKFKLRVTSGGKVVEKQSEFYVYAPMIIEKSIIYHLDLSKYRRIDATNQKLCEEAFDTLHLIAVLQGIVNREKPQLYINYNDVDQFWLDFMRTPDGYLANADIVKISNPMEAIEIFKDYIKGIVVWDESVPATSYIATTVCGVEDLLPVRLDESDDSMYSKLINNSIGLGVKHNFVGMFTGKGFIPGTDRPSTKSAKNDAYIWAKINYLDTGKCSGTEIGLWCDAFWLKHPQDMSIDNVGLTNHDYIVSKRGFMLDLSVWGDEAPRDDPDQELGTDLNTLKEILEACYKLAGNKMIHISGFTPWAIKYTSHNNAGGKHHAVSTEWETVKIVSAYNAFLDADAIGLVSMANASVFTHYKLPDRLIQNNKPTFEDLLSKGYIDKNGKIADRNFLYHYVGDYDAASWLYNVMPGIWADPMRGKVPAGHAFNPNLIERFPLIFQWVYDSKSANDYFIAGDSGAGYVNPTQIIEPRKLSNLPSGADTWIEHNKKYYRKLNYSITGFLLNGSAGALNDEAISMYKSFSGDGVLTHTIWLPADKKFNYLLEWMPVGETYNDLEMNDDKALGQLTAQAKTNQPGFISIRTILKDMHFYSRINNFIQQSRPDLKFEPVEPYTYMYLLRHHLGGKNECRATFTFDTLPSEASSKSEIKFTLGIRNDGWEEWKKDGENAVSVWVCFEGEEPILIPIEHNVLPSEGIVIELNIPTPSTVGEQIFTIDLRKNGVGTYSEHGNLPWQQKINLN